GSYSSDFLTRSIALSKTILILSSILSFEHTVNSLYLILLANNRWGNTRIKVIVNAPVKNVNNIILKVLLNIFFIFIFILCCLSAGCLKKNRDMLCIYIFI